VASSSGTTTAETVESTQRDSQRKHGPIGDKTGNTTSTSETGNGTAAEAPGAATKQTASSQQRVIDIGDLDGDEFLCMLRGYVNSMCDFAKSNRNVHKELKHTLSNSNAVLT